MRAVIFDMNGVIIDDMRFHKPVWQEIAKRLGVTLTDKEFDTKINGRTNRETIEYILSRSVSKEELERIENEKEEIYRATYLPHRKLLAGLEGFLKALRVGEVPIGVATSAPRGNVEFILDGLEIREFFSAVVDASEVKKGKPDPEIYLKAASKLGQNPEDCLVFEDSLHGISAARSAGMQVIGLTTTHSAEELSGTILNIPDYTGMNIDMLRQLT